RYQAVVKLGSFNAVELRRLVVLVDIADGDKIDAGRAPAEPVRKKKVHKDLLDVDRAMQLIVGIEGNPAMLELDLGVEDDVGSYRIGRQQHEAMRIEAVLPLAAGRWILHRPVFDLAIRPDAQPGHGRLDQAEYAFPARLCACRWNRSTRQRREQLLVRCFGCALQWAEGRGTRVWW